MVVHRDGHRPLGEVLADDVLVQKLFELAGRGDAAEAGPAAVHAATFLLEDVLAELGAVGADVNIIRAFDHGTDFPR